MRLFSCYNRDMTSMSKARDKADYPKTERIMKSEDKRNTYRTETSQHKSHTATCDNTILIGLPPEDYALLVRRAAQEGISAEQLLAQKINELCHVDTPQGEPSNRAANKNTNISL